MVAWYALGREWPWIAGSLSEPLICDFSGIVTEVSLFPKSCSKMYFCENMRLVE